jgi:hypothetical protein
LYYLCTQSRKYRLILQEKELLIVDPKQVVIGAHEPYSKVSLSFLNASISSRPFAGSNKVTGCVKLPEQGSRRGSLFLGCSNGDVYRLDLDVHNHGQLVMLPIFHTNPVSQAMHYSPKREDDDILIIGGEMSDTTICQVFNSNLSRSDLDIWKSV